MLKTMVTARRKLTKSLQQRGLGETIVRCVTRPARAAWDITHWLSPRFRKIRREHQLWDLEHGVDTAPGNQSGWMADIDSENWAHGRGYHPAPFESLVSRLGALNIDYPKYTFIDFGSGKGRSLFAASVFPFKKIIGVEFNQALHETAERNIQSYRNDTQACFNIEAVHADAATFEIPNEHLVLYFYDPFSEEVMKPVFDRIVACLEKNRLSCNVVYFNPVFAEYFEDCEHFRRLAAGSQFMDYWKRTQDGNKDANEFASEVLDSERYVVYETTF